MRVIKFGGSSVSTADHIRHVTEIIRSDRYGDPLIYAVFSASGDTTDHLESAARSAQQRAETYEPLLEHMRDHHLSMAQELLSEERGAAYQAYLRGCITELSDLIRGVWLLRELTPRAQDAIMGMGERLSAPLINYYLQDLGCISEYVDMRDLIITESTPSGSQVNKAISYPLMRHHAGQAQGILCCTGYIARTVDGISTTLGRGGSDYTAALLGSALDAESIDIWTDVDGVLSSDPRVIDNPRRISHMSYEEAQELSHFGAKVIYAPTIQPAIESNIPINILNSYNPESPGTRISNQSQAATPGRPIRGVTAISSISLLTLRGSGMVGIPGISGRLFTALAESNINVILITQGSSEHAITFAISPEDESAALKSLEYAFRYEIEKKIIDPPIAENNLSILALVGEQMRTRHGIAGKIFSTLGEHRVNVVAVAQGSSELNISIVLAADDLHRAMRAIHDEFFDRAIQPVHLYVIGAGLVGQRFLEQLSRQQKPLLHRHGIDCRLVGLANSTKMILNPEGIDIDTWQEQLHAASTPSSMDEMIRRAGELDLAHSVLVDITASDAVTTSYHRALASNLSIATANKIAFSRSREKYEALIQQTQYRDQFIVFETTVGAGLPILNTIRGFLQSGDRIRRIEGILSGSLSYIFTELNNGKAFSEAISDARDQGYTEPDPREDLSGMDFKRKLAILANLAEFNISIEDIEMDALLPAALIDLPTVSAFMERLTEADGPISQLTPLQDSMRWRLVGSVEQGSAAIRLRAVDAGSPFYHLSGSDNLIAIFSDRYHTQPLIIRGPGAGAEVTAGGLLSDIISRFNTPG